MIKRDIKFYEMPIDMTIIEILKCDNILRG